MNILLFLYALPDLTIFSFLGFRTGTFTCLPPQTWVNSINNSQGVYHSTNCTDSLILYDNYSHSSYTCIMYFKWKKNVVSFFFSLRDLYQSQIGQRIIHKEYVSFWIGSVQISIILDTKIKLCCLIVEDTLPSSLSSHFGKTDTHTKRKKYWQKWHYARQNPANLTVTDLILLKAVQYFQLNVSLLCAFTGAI